MVILCSHTFLLSLYLGSDEVYFKQNKMKEYTILSVLSVFSAILIDRALKTGLLKRKLFWLFLIIIACFKFLVNGYLTGSGIVNYNPYFFLGARIGTIPLEDFFFGFSMVLISVSVWEYFKKIR